MGLWRAKAPRPPEYVPNGFVESNMKDAQPHSSARMLSNAELVMASTVAQHDSHIYIELRASLLKEG